MLRTRPVLVQVSRAVVAAAAVLLAIPGMAIAAPGTGSSGGSSDPAPVPHPNNYAMDCPDVMVLAVSGGTDSDIDRNPLEDGNGALWGDWLQQVTLPVGEASKDSPGSVGWMYVPYPSTYGLGLLEDVPNYQDSTLAGVASMNKLLDENKTKCGDETKYVLLGYSIGSEVVERVARDIGHRGDDALVNGDDIAGVALIADPYRPAGTPSLGKPGPAGGGFMSSEPADYGTLSEKMMFACRPYDIACDAPQEIAVLELALGVLGQMRFTILDPGQSVADFGRAVSSMAARAIVHIVTRDGWIESDESFLDVLRKVADKSYDPDGPGVETEVSREQLVEALNWAMGPGSEVVEAKLRAEGRGFLEDNSDMFDLVTKPYIFLGVIQHMAYWNNNPNDPWYWESEKVVDWITELAAAEKAKNTPVEPAPTGN